MKPRVEGAPGLIWRRDKKDKKWEALWRARTDIIDMGFRPKNKTLWSGTDQPTEKEADYIADQCRRMQDEMLAFGRDHQPNITPFDGTLRSLVNCYQTDKDSSYHKKRYHVRRQHDADLRRLVSQHGTEQLHDINARLLLAWHKEWLGPEGVKVAMAHAFIAHLRTCFSFGATLLEDRECERLCGVLSKMRFPMPKARVSTLTADMAIAIRAKAHERGWIFIALAQAFQFELMLRQKDVVGEWLPLSEPGISDCIAKGKKWLVGLRWEEIDQNMILKHVTSKRQKEIVIDLKLAGMVLEEFRAIYGTVDRSELPASGPVILCEINGLPYTSFEYRRKWRKVATAAGVPKTVKNMDSRAGAISEATDAGADLEHVRHAATHSDIAMTQRYSRGAAEKVENVMQLRAKHRNKPKT